MEWKKKKNERSKRGRKKGKSWGGKETKKERRKGWERKNGGSTKERKVTELNQADWDKMLKQFADTVTSK